MFGSILVYVNKFSQKLRASKQALKKIREIFYICFFYLPTSKLRFHDFRTGQQREKKSVRPPPSFTASQPNTTSRSKGFRGEINETRTSSLYSIARRVAV
jgi:hypothetical protein